MRGLWVSFVTLSILLMPVVALARPADAMP
jgi:hypothetical protein